MSITVIDYGVGNLGSIVNMLKKAGAEAHVTGDPQKLRLASRLILPGVGAFDAGMGNLRKSGLFEALEEAVLKRSIPILGICLGMQLLTRSSEEGVAQGLGWIAGVTKRFAFTAAQVQTEARQLRIPHMGWNSVECERPNALFSSMEGENRFYFVHSYHLVLDHPGDSIGKTQYGYPFVSSVQRGHIAGVQFHPEKSHRFGWQLLKNFAEKEWWR